MRGDARQWQCAAEDQERCRQVFVVDRIAWANGDDIPLTAPQPWNEAKTRQLDPRLTKDQAIAAVGGRQEPVAVAAFEAGEIARIDPRWNLAGDHIVWIVPSIGPVDPSGDATRSVTVSLVDDATGAILDTHDLALDAAYRPARLWALATVRGYECCAGGVGARYSVASADGTLLHEGSAGRSARGSDDGHTTFGPDEPLVLGAGTYTVKAWLAGADAPDNVSSECLTEISLNELNDLMLEAVFPATGGSCMFGPPSAPKLTFL